MYWVDQKTGTATAAAATGTLTRWIESVLLLLCGGGKSQRHTAGWYRLQLVASSAAFSVCHQ